MEIGKEVSIKLQRVEATQGWDSGTDGAGETSRKVKGPTLIVSPAAILQQVHGCKVQGAGRREWFESCKRREMLKAPCTHSSSRRHCS